MNSFSIFSIHISKVVNLKHFIGGVHYWQPCLTCIPEMDPVASISGRPNPVVVTLGKTFHLLSTLLYLVWIQNKNGQKSFSKGFFSLHGANYEQSHRSSEKWHVKERGQQEIWYSQLSRYLKISIQVLITYIWSNMLGLHAKWDVISLGPL